MTKAVGKKHYEERLNRVRAYIHDHLDEKIDLNKLAEIAYLSPYHWHRIYHAFYGETVAATVKRLRLHRAAGYLVNTSMKVEEIAEKSGYPNLQSFTRIFKSVFGMPPAQYRNHGSHTQFQREQRGEDLMIYDIDVKTVPALKAITIEHAGPFMAIGKTFDNLMGLLTVRNSLPADMRVVGIFYDDPDVTPEEKLRSRAGVVTQTGVAVEPPLEHTAISGGQYAVLRHKGPYANMKVAYGWLYGEWLLSSGREAANEPGFEEYLNNPGDTPPTELLTDIYLPLKA